MNKRNEALVPRFLTEDYLAVSRLLVGTAWLLVIGAVLVRAWVLPSLKPIICLKALATGC